MGRLRSARQNLSGRVGLSMVMTLSSLMIVGLILLLMAGVLLPNVSGLLEQNAVERTKDTALQSTHGIELYIENIIATLHFSASLIAEMDMGEETSFSRVGLMKESQADIINMALFDAEGRMIYATSEDAGVPPPVIAASSWFIKALEWEGTLPYFSNPSVQMLYKDQYRWVISLSRAVEFMEGGASKTGVLLIDYNYAAVSQLTQNVSLGTSGYAFIIDKEDALISHPKLQLIYAGIATEDLSAVARQVTGVCRDVQDGRERVLVINTIEQTRWRMVGVAYIDEILRLQMTFLRLFSIALACGGLFAVGAATITAYYVTRPIRSLEDRMRQVERGDFDLAVDRGGFKEIRSLSTAFGHMLERIRLLMRQIVTEQETKRLHELNALQAQINPHFLYNTLDSIIWMEERGRSAEAIEMVSALAKLFRISISHGRNLITVREELEHVRNYLIIQQMRFRNQFTYEINVDREAAGLYTVKLIVQPLVENAVHHGIYSYDDKKLSILITAKREGDRLLLVVKDDGVGIPEQKLSGILSAPAGRGGIGLRNVNERIKLTCGQEYGLSVISVEEKGTTVIVTLPVDLEG